MAQLAKVVVGEPDETVASALSVGESGRLAAREVFQQLLGVSVG